MLANAGVNINDSVQVRNYLNSYYNRNYSYAAYSQVLSGCANQTLNYVLALPGIEAEEAKGGYRFGFNGQEKDDEVAGAGNSMTAMFWEYDARLGRRWNIDPKSITGISEYACFANNPIVFRDINGDKIGKGKDRAQKIKDVAGNKVKANNERSRRLNERIERKESKGKTPEKLYRKREALYENNLYLRQMIRKVESLENDPNQVYNFLDSDNGQNETKYDVDTKEINFYTNGTVAMDAHEMTHGYQFKTGKISFRDGGAPGFLYDLNDEYEAYMNQYLIDPVSVGFLISLENIKNVSSVKGELLYINLPKANLTNASLVYQVYEAHNMKMDKETMKYSKMLYSDYVKKFFNDEIIKK